MTTKVWSGGFGDVFDALGPGFELCFGIEIVVAFGRWGIGIVAEPGVVTAAVEADVADGRSDALAGFEGAADDRLIDIAEADAALMEQIVEFFFGPGGVADFDDQRVIVELVEQAFRRLVVSGVWWNEKGNCRSMAPRRLAFCRMSRPAGTNCRCRRQLGESS